MIFNPAARGNKKARTVQSLVMQRLHSAGYECALCETKGRGDATRAARNAVESGYDLLVAVGGDGTVTDVGNAVVGTGCSLGVVPSGTANLLARGLGIPTRVDRAIRTLVGPNRVRVIDVARVNDRFCLVAAGAGLDAHLMRQTPPWLKRLLGRWAYVAMVVKNAFSRPAGEFTVRTDAGVTRATALSVVVANFGDLGWSWLPIGPDISATDGKLDLCIIAPRGFLQSLALAMRLLFRRYGSTSYLKYLKADEAFIECSSPVGAQCDGELIGDTPLSVQIVPSALRVIVPK